jgi:hypothetical protein
MVHPILSLQATSRAFHEKYEPAHDTMFRMLFGTYEMVRKQIDPEVIGKINAAATAFQTRMVTEVRQATQTLEQQINAEAATFRLQMTNSLIGSVDVIDEILEAYASFMKVKDDLDVEQLAADLKDLDDKAATLTKLLKVNKGLETKNPFRPRADVVSDLKHRFSQTAQLVSTGMKTLQSLKDLATKAAPTAPLSPMGPPPPPSLKPLSTSTPVTKAVKSSNLRMVVKALPGFDKEALKEAAKKIPKSITVGDKKLDVPQAGCKFQPSYNLQNNATTTINQTTPIQIAPPGKGVGIYALRVYTVELPSKVMKQTHLYCYTEDRRLDLAKEQEEIQFVVKKLGFEASFVFRKDDDKSDGGSEHGEDRPQKKDEPKGSDGQGGSKDNLGDKKGGTSDGDKQDDKQDRGKSGGRGGKPKGSAKKSTDEAASEAASGDSKQDQTDSDGKKKKKKKKKKKHKTDKYEFETSSSASGDETIESLLKQSSRSKEKDDGDGDGGDDNTQTSLDLFDDDGGTGGTGGSGSQTTQVKDQESSAMEVDPPAKTTTTMREDPNWGKVITQPERGKTLVLDPNEIYRAIGQFHSVGRQLDIRQALQNLNTRAASQSVVPVVDVDDDDDCVITHEEPPPPPPPDAADTMDVDNASKASAHKPDGGGGGDSNVTSKHTVFDTSDLAAKLERQRSASRYPIGEGPGQPTSRPNYRTQKRKPVDANVGSTQSSFFANLEEEKKTLSTSGASSRRASVGSTDEAGEAAAAPTIELDPDSDLVNYYEKVGPQLIPDPPFEAHMWGYKEGETYTSQSLITIPADRVAKLDPVLERDDAGNRKVWCEPKKVSDIVGVYLKVPGKWECRYCKSDTFESYADYQDHLMSIHKKLRFPCLHCCKPYKTLDERKRHEQRHYTHEPPKKEGGKSAGLHMQCLLCARSGKLVWLGNEDKYVAHLCAEHKLKHLRRCPRCNEPKDTFGAWKNCRNTCVSSGKLTCSECDDVTFSGINQSEALSQKFDHYRKHHPQHLSLMFYKKPGVNMLPLEPKPSAQHGKAKCRECKENVFYSKTRSNKINAEHRQKVEVLAHMITCHSVPKINNFILSYIEGGEVVETADQARKYLTDKPLTSADLD